MSSQIALFLAEDGIITGAIYALLALAIVLVFTVTRVLFVPQGEYVTYGALSFAAFQLGRTPGVVWLLALLAAAATVVEIVQAVREQRRREIGRILLVYAAIPAVIVGLTIWLAPTKPPLIVQILLSVALVSALGAPTYRLAFQPLREASVLVLMIAAIAAHFVFQGAGLLFFGADGYHTAPFFQARLNLGAIVVPAQGLWVLGTSAVGMILLYAFFGFTLFGKAMRAVSRNRLGARLCGVSVAATGQLAFTLAAVIGGISGVMIVGLTNIYYDSGFLIGLKGIVGAIFGALGSFPLAVLGALVVGQVETFGSFWSSPYKETIVFSFLIPILVWLSLRAFHVEEEEE